MRIPVRVEFVEQGVVARYFKASEKGPTDSEFGQGSGIFPQQASLFCATAEELAEALGGARASSDALSEPIARGCGGVAIRGEGPGLTVEFLENGLAVHFTEPRGVERPAGGISPSFRSGLRELARIFAAALGKEAWESGAANEAGDEPKPEAFTVSGLSSAFCASELEAALLVFTRARTAHELLTKAALAGKLLDETHGGGGRALLAGL